MPAGNPRVWAFHDSRGFGSREPSGCGYFRVVLPFDALKANGWHANYACALPEAGEGDYDIFVGQRCDQPMFRPVWDALQQIRREEGLKLVYEIDDDPFTLDPVNWLAMPSYSNPEILATIRYLASTADLVTVTTQALAERFREFNESVAVLPNCVADAVLHMKRRRHRQVTIGYTCGCSHSRDLAMIAQTWRDVTDSEDCHGHFMGTDFRTILRPDGFEFTPWEPDMAAYYARIDFDIGLAPLSDHPFNGGKSPLKALEYAAMGIPVIASDHPVYRDFVVDGVTGILCRTQAHWREAMRLLVNDAPLREAMGAKGREQAAAWTIEKNFQRWADAYCGLMTEERHG